MKKIIALILAGLLLAGCSTNGTQKQDKKYIPEETTVSSEKQKELQKQQETDVIKESEKGQEAQKSTVDKTWFTGSIGSAKIHAKLDITGDKVSGVYYYDKYKTNIKLEGSIGNELKDAKTIYLNEDTDKKANIKGLLRSEDYIEGMWRSDNSIYPMYLIREGANITPPSQPGKYAKMYDGHWTGKNKVYHVGSEADIKVLFDDLIFYDLSAFNGSHSGGLESFGTIKNNTVKTAFTEKTYDEKKENVIFEFSVENNILKLKSNMYDYSCGMAVRFDSEYIKGKVNIPIPSAQELGIVDTKEQDELFKRIVGNDYNTFIDYTQGVSYSEVEMDGKKVKAGTSFLKGLHGYCFYIISPDYIYAAVIGDNGINYYTNDKKYANELPQPMKKWVEGKSSKIIYNYKQ